MTEPLVLVVDDEKSMRELLAITLERQGYEVSVAEDGEVAIEAVRRDGFDVIITDLRMPNADGLQVLRAAKEHTPETVVIVITAVGSTETAVEAMKLGAYDYITKPFKLDELKIIIKNALSANTLKQENIQLKRALEKKYSFRNIVGSSPSMLKLYDMIQRISQTKSNILINGESGTGKELIARAIHYNGPLKDKPFITINCGAIPENLLESEMFGHKKGSFTGAIADKKGLFEVADTGTIFLD